MMSMVSMVCGSFLASPACYPIRRGVSSGPSRESKSTLAGADISWAQNIHTQF